MSWADDIPFEDINDSISTLGGVVTSAIVAANSGRGGQQQQQQQQQPTVIYQQTPGPSYVAPVNDLFEQTVLGVKVKYVAAGALFAGLLGVALYVR